MLNVGAEVTRKELQCGRCGMVEDWRVIEMIRKCRCCWSQMHGKRFALFLPRQSVVVAQ